MPLYIKERCVAYTKPLYLLALALYGGLIAILRTATRSPGDLLSIAKVKDAIFGAFWLRMGPMFAESDKETAIPALVAQASGTVLELGPGMGSQLPRYDVSKITKIYGVEPNADLHDALRKKVKQCGLTDIYEIVPCGIDDAGELKRHGIRLESIDTLLSVQVLCSVPDPGEMMRRLYALLKPGGRFVVYEHVRSRDAVSRVVQNIYNTAWPFFIGNCHLDRDTQRSIIQAGRWEQVDLTVPTAEDAWSVFPRIHGRLWKAQ